MENLSDELLIEAYFKTKELNLDYQFSKLIKKELERRTIKAIN